MQHNFLILNGLTNMVVGSYGKAYCNTLYVHNRLVDLVVFSHIKQGQDLAEQTTDKSGTSPHGEIACPQWGTTLLQNVGLKRDSGIKAPRVYVCDYAHVFVLHIYSNLHFWNNISNFHFQTPNLTLCLEKI